MHELSVAESIFDTALKELDNRKLERLMKVVVRVGVLTDVAPQALTFGFDIIKRESSLAETSLEIESVPVKGRCNGCGRSFEVEEFIFVCPLCEACDIEITEGDELEIAYLMVDDGEEKLEGFVD